MEIVKIVYEKGMAAKVLGHLHERNACVDILKNIIMSTGIYKLNGVHLSSDQLSEVLEIKRLIVDLMLEPAV